MELAPLVVIFFLTSIISVVTGGTSLITVPAMLQFGIEPRSAVATNMLALTLMSIGGSLSFSGSNLIDRRRSGLLIVFTLAGSILGALLLLVVPSKALPVIIALFMIGVALFTTIKRQAGVGPTECQPSRGREIAGYGATFVLGVYGGFFSGGYVTLLIFLVGGHSHLYVARAGRLQAGYCDGFRHVCGGLRWRPCCPEAEQCMAAPYLSHSGDRAGSQGVTLRPIATQVNFGR